MEKLYSLLRNNKQSGPYSLRELVEQSLKPKDLIWHQGKSAGWSYPSEMDILKPYLQNEIPAVQSAVSEPRQRRTSSVTLAPQYGKSQMQSNKTSHIFVSLPASPRKIVAGERESYESSFEQRAEELKRKIIAGQNGTIPSVAPNRYPNALLDRKVQNVHGIEAQKKKNNSNLPLNNMTITTLLFIMCMSSFLLTGWLFNSDSSTLQTSAPSQKNQANYERTEPAAVNANYASDRNSSAKEIEVNPSNLDAKVVASRSLDIKAEKNNATSNPEVKPNASVVRNTETRVTNTTAAIKTPEPEKSQTIKESPSVSAPSKTVEKQGGIPSENVASLPKDEQSKQVGGNRNLQIKKLITLLTSYIVEKETMRNVGTNITLRNSSDQALKKVAVNIFYHSGDNKVVDKKTVYFSDIPPHSTFTLKAPMSPIADKAYTLLGMVDSEKGNVDPTK